MDATFLVMWVGFFLASYSVVGNDVIQTLGTFLTSNEKDVKWYYLWAFASSILVFALVQGYMANDIDYGRLDKFDLEAIPFNWYYVLPPLVLMLITRLGIPVSTTFMVLTLFSLSKIPNDLSSMMASVFDTEQKLGGMIQKSIMGYIIAFVAAIVIYLIITRLLENKFLENPINKVDKASMKDKITVFISSVVASAVVACAYGYFKDVLSIENIVFFLTRGLGLGVILVGLMTAFSKKTVWIITQWFATGFLWYQWLTQDLANIYIYLRGGVDLSVGGFAISLLILVGLLGYIFYSRGGAVQDVVRVKTNTADIRSATFIDLIYGVILYIFKFNYFGLFEAKLPMSTTWVFIGLLAGREIGIRLNLDKKLTAATTKMVFTDLAKIFFGLLVSVVLVFIIKLIGG